MLMEKYKCEKHNKVLTLIETEEGFCAYVCTECNKENNYTG